MTDVRATRQKSMQWNWEKFENGRMMKLGEIKIHQVTAKKIEALFRALDANDSNSLELNDFELVHGLKNKDKATDLWGELKAALFPVDNTSARHLRDLMKIYPEDFVEGLLKGAKGRPVKQVQTLRTNGTHWRTCLTLPPPFIERICPTSQAQAAPNTNEQLLAFAEASFNDTLQDMCDSLDLELIKKQR